MGSKLSMNVHVCGLDFNDAQNYQMQIDIIKQIFPIINGNESNQYYDLRKSEKPKWNAFIYKNNSDFEYIKYNILEQIRIGGLNNNEKKEYKNNMILCFADNNKDLLLCQEFNKRNIRAQLAHYFPLILFIFKENVNLLSYRDESPLEKRRVRKINMIYFYLKTLI